MRVLVTGSSGFLGKFTVNEFQKEGYDVVPMVRKSSGLCNEVICDLSTASSKELYNIVKHAKIVVHLASKVDFSDSLYLRLFETNTLASLRLAKAVEQAGGKLIFASTMTIQGRYAEYVNGDSLDDPDTPYSMSKWVAERVIEESCSNAVILRISGIFGFDGPSHLSLNQTITHALKYKETPTRYGEGRAKRNYIYVKDVAKWIRFVAEKQLYGTYYVAGNEILSIREMLNFICRKFLNGIKPLEAEGKEASSQICEVSEPHPSLFSFEEALEDIKLDYEKNFRNLK